MSGLARRQAHRPRAVRLVAWMGCIVLSNGVFAVARPGSAWGQAVSSATITEVLDSDQVYIQNQRARVNSVAQRQQRVRTQAARAALRFNNGAVARLSHNSSLVVGQCAQLTQGSLLVNGSLNGCSTTTIAGVRGTIYTLEITEEGDTLIQVFEGEVVVGRQPETPDPVEEDDFPSPDPSESESDLDTEPTDTPPTSPDDGDLPTEEEAPGSKQILPKPTVPPLPSNPNSAEEPESMDELEDTETIEDDDTGSNSEDIPTDGTSDTEANETVEFNPEDSLVIAEGQQVTVDAENDEAVIADLTAEDFINLLEGPLISGFAAEIPGIGDLQGVFRRLFPDIPLPFGLPSIPIPLPPIRFPF